MFPGAKSVHHLFTYTISLETQKSSCCFDSFSTREINLIPRAGSSTRVNVEAQFPHSQNCAVSRWGFSSNIAEEASLVVTEIEMTSN